MTLSIVPLFYFYTKVGRYVRSQLYGFVSWLTSGNEVEIRIRKTILSAHRGRFEEVIFEHDIPGAITRRIGSGPRAVDGTVQFYQRLLELLERDPSETTSESFKSELQVIMKQLTAPRLGKMAKQGRKFDTTQKTTINLKVIFENAVRCEICGGILNLRSGVQYDHRIRYAESHITDTDEGRPTHPFCNNQRDAIEAHHSGRSKLAIPLIRRDPISVIGKPYQLSMFDLFGQTAFPDE